MPVELYCPSEQVSRIVARTEASSSSVGRRVVMSQFLPRDGSQTERSSLP